MTKTSTLDSYETRLGRVTDHIYDHLDDEIGIDRLAEIACLSPYHWHRIYTAMRGETVTATIKRLRLARAADRLANSDMAVPLIAERAGYGTVESFGRAFKEAYGQPPADYRANGSHAAFKAANASEDAAGFPIEIVDLPPLRCASVPHRGSYMQIDRAMGRLFDALGKQRLLDNGTRMIGLFLDDPDLVPTEDLRSKACAPMADGAVLAEPLEQTIIRSGPYARLRYQGPYADMRGAYRWLLGVWLPRSGRDAADAPIFEAYLNSPTEVSPADLLTDIHLPLET